MARKIILALGVTLALAGGLSNVAWADADDAGGELDVVGLKHLCQETAQPEGCRYFIYGVIEGATFGDDMKVPGGSQLCVAPDASIGDLETAVKTALSGMKNLDDEIDIPAAAFVATVARREFPCVR